MNGRSICVMMSTYNGEKYLLEQLKSIYQQRDVKTTLLVRDDASTDSTREILEDESREKRLEWYAGENLGPAYSFMHLLQSAPSDSDFYAFSDQDDVWLDDKLSVAVQTIGEDARPVLYISSTRNVDENFRPLPQHIIAPSLTYGESLIRQYASGCTMVFNEKMRQLLLSYKPCYLAMHDMWILSVALSVGAKVIYDPVPHILYRQHSRNVVGETTSIKGRLAKRLRRIKKNEHIRSRTAAELLIGFGSKMSKENRRLTRHAAQCHTSWKSRFLLLSCRSLWSSDIVVSLTSRMAILTGTF